jgi:hypothetical protein
MPKTKILKQVNITVVKNMKDYSNDPLVIEKGEKASTFLKKHPLPKEFTKSSGTKKKVNNPHK